MIEDKLIEIVIKKNDTLKLRNAVHMLSTFFDRKIAASMEPSAYIDRPQTLCWNSNETLLKIQNSQHQQTRKEKWKLV